MSHEPMITDRTDNFAARASAVDGPVLLANLFTAKPGMSGRFIQVQTDEYVRLLGKVKGWLGNRLGRSVDGEQIVNVAMLESLDCYNDWRDSDLFHKHVEVIQPFVENAAPGMYELLYSAGDL